MDEVDFFGNLGKVESVLQGGIAAAYNGDGFAPKKEAIAGRTIRDTFTKILKLSGSVQFLGRAPGGQNDSMGLQNGAVGKMYRMVCNSWFRGDDLFLENLEVVRFGVLQKFFAQFKTTNLDKTWGSSRLPWLWPLARQKHPVR